jgi:hypothetical protein
VRETLDVFVCREVVVWEGVDDLDRDMRDPVGVPERAVGPMPLLVVEDGAPSLVAFSLDVNALDEVVDDARLLRRHRCFEATAKSM